MIKDYVEIDKRFQNSVNLQLDLQNDKKLNSYIPTRSSVAILKTYLNHVYSDEKDKATILIGPYGKGKSHLLLVLMRLISTKDEKNVEKVLKTIEAVDKETAEVAKNIIKEKKRILPVIVSGTDGALNQAFLIGLVEALKREGIEGVAPDTYYSKAIEAIARWKENYPDTYQAFCEKIEKNETVEDYIEALKRNSKTTLKSFEKIYPKLTAGSKFQPILPEDVVKIYQGINKQLQKEFGYQGIFIIFDEFSKYVEGHEEATFSRDMGILQDMCELAVNSKEQQLHIVCVAHKSIKEYGNSLSREKVNAFTGVEGRLTEELFIVSSHNNYELIQSALKKKNEKYKEIINKDECWKELISSSYSIPCFNTLFEEDDYRKIIGEGCYPLYPITSYILLNISEKVAQNERSVFTFLANDEQGSVVTAINNGRAALEGIGSDMVYDYFENLFRENISATSIHAEWLKADYALNQKVSDIEKKVIKAIALLLMIHKEEEAPCHSSTIRMAAGLSTKDYTEAIRGLEDKNLVIKRSRTNAYAFKNNIGVDIDNEIKEAIHKQTNKIDYMQLLSEVGELDYILPKRYNQEFTMTRFFDYTYMTSEQFLNLSDVKYLFEQKNADGKIVAILRKSSDVKKEILEHIKKLNDERLVVIYPKENFEQEKTIRKYLAVRELQRDEEFLEHHKVLIQELKLYEEDLLFEINASLEAMYYPENDNCDVYHLGEKRKRISTAAEFNRILSNILESYYGLTPKINSEQINRQNITAQMKKARNIIVSGLLAGEDFTKYSKGTSPEATICRATLYHTGVLNNENELDEGCKQVIQEIRRFMDKAVGKKAVFDEIYKVLLGEHYGVRKGVVPIFIAKEIASLNDTPVIYLQDKEVAIDENAFNNINENPQDYYLYIERETAAKEKYISELEKEFLSESQRSRQVTKGQRLSRLVGEIQRYYRSLPQCTLNFREEIEGVSSDEMAEVVAFRNTFRRMEINARDILFERLPEIYNCENNYIVCGEKILKTRDILNGYLPHVTENVKASIREVYGASQNESISAILKDWYALQSDEAKKHLMSNQVSMLMNYIENLHTHDEDEIAGRVVKIVTDMYIEDWNDTSYEEFAEQLKQLHEEVEKTDNQENQEGRRKVVFTDSQGKEIERYFDTDDDSASYFLKNALNELLEDFGDTLEMNQKVAVMMEALEEIIKQ